MSSSLHDPRKSYFAEQNHICLCILEAKDMHSVFLRASSSRQQADRK
jgi:hypothetical protein